MINAGLKFVLKLTLIAVGAIAVISIVLMSLGWWRLNQGPVSLSFVGEHLESIVNSQLKGISIKIKDVVLERDEKAGRIHFRLRGLRLFDNSGTILARAPRATLGIKGTNILTGNFSPTKLTLIGPNLILNRKKNGEIELGFGDDFQEEQLIQGNIKDTQNVHKKSDRKPLTKTPKPEQQTRAKLLQFALQILSQQPGKANEYSSLEDISIRDATITLNDQANGTIWTAPRANLVLQRAPAGVSILADIQIAAGKHPWKVKISANYSKSDSNMHVVIDAQDIVPAEIAQKIPWLADLAEIRLPLQGRVIFDIGKDGSLRHAQARLSAGAGFLAIPGVLPKPILVDEGVIAMVYSPLSGDLTIDKSALFIGRNKMEIKGLVSPRYDKTGRLNNISFNLVSENVDINPKGQTRPKNTTVIDRVAAKGVVDVKQERIDLKEFSLLAGQAKIFLTGSVDGYGAIPAIKLKGKMTNVPISLVLDLWPPVAAEGARSWLVENFVYGLVTQAGFMVDITSQALDKALKGAPLSKEQLFLRFSAEKIITRYLDDMPAIRNAKAEGMLRGDEFSLSVNTGRIRLKSGEYINLSDGSVVIKGLSQKDTPTEIKVTGRASAKSIAHLIEHQPLGYMTKFGVKPEEIGGIGEVKLHLSFPLLKDLKLEEITVKANAKINKFSLPRVIGKSDITNGAIELDITGKGLIGKGNIVLNGVNAKLVWHENFNKSVKFGSRYLLELQLNDRARKKFGIDLDHFMTGPVKLKITARGNGPDIKQAKIKVDLARAHLFFKSINWKTKPAKRAYADIDLVMLKGGDILLKKLNIAARAFSLKGTMRIDGSGKIKSLNFPAIKLGKTGRFAVKARNKRKTGLDISVRGKKFDARKMITAFLKGESQKQKSGPQLPGPPKPGRGMLITADIGRVVAHQGVVLNALKAKLVMYNDRVQTLKLTSLFANKSPFSLDVSKNKRNVRTIEALSSNAGSVLRGLDIYGKISRGDLQFKMTLSPPNGNGLRAGGVLKIEKFSIDNEKALASVSFKQGAHNPNTTTLSFSELKAPFELRAGNLIINRSIIKGSTFGATARGVFNTVNEKLSIHGTLIPAYALNSFLSRVPILGQVLVGGKDQGLFGVTYSISGTLAKPRFAINPISALTPGFLRLFFDGADPAADLPPAESPRKKPKAKNNLTKVK